MKTIANCKLQIANFKSQASLLLTAYCLLLTAAHAEIIDRIVAVVNDSAITLSELDAATAGLGGIKGDDKEKRKRIIETKSKVLDQIIEKKLVEQASNKAGITVSEKEIDNAIEDVKQENNLGHEELLSALAKSGLTYKNYREQLKELIRDVIKTSTGFHIIQMVDIRKGEARPLAEVEDNIKNIIYQKIIDEKYKLWLEDMMKKAYIEVRL